jgi:predicted nucleic acid-binding protein
MLTRIGQITIGPAIVEAASRLPQSHLRSLDAIHLATALHLGPDLTAFVSYDKRLVSAAQAERLPILAPAG